jgi:hypothetical protein
MNVAYAAGYPCPEGSYAIPSDCPASPDSVFFPYYRESCAYYRAFDATGTLLGAAAATAGVITITGDDTACTFAVELSFAGEPFTDSFTLVDGLTADPWCTP